MRRKCATVCVYSIRFSYQFGGDEMNSEEDEEEPTRNQLQESTSRNNGMGYDNK